jgi:hypothetical protein
MIARTRHDRIRAELTDFLRNVHGVMFIVDRERQTPEDNPMIKFVYERGVHIRLAYFSLDGEALLLEPQIQEDARYLEQQLRKEIQKEAMKVYDKIRYRGTIDGLPVLNWEVDRKNKIYEELRAITKEIDKYPEQIFVKEENMPGVRIEIEEGTAIAYIDYDHILHVEPEKLELSDTIVASILGGIELALQRMYPHGTAFLGTMQKAIRWDLNYKE